MADNNGKRHRLIRQRVAALAVMHLTHRQDLKVAEVDEDTGVDLRIRIVRPTVGSGSSASHCAAPGRRLPPSR